MFSQKCIPTQKFAVLGAHRNTIPAVWYDRCVTKCAVVKGLKGEDLFIFSLSRRKIHFTAAMRSHSHRTRSTLLLPSEGHRIQFSLFSSQFPPSSPGRVARYLIVRGVCTPSGRHNCTRHVQFPRSLCGSRTHDAWRHVFALFATREAWNVHASKWL